jgi:phosphatidylserine/phosphatidylglycerophosphate/cardiolipin synthase-like enzyme
MNFSMRLNGRFLAFCAVLLGAFLSAPAENTAVGAPAPASTATVRRTAGKVAGTAAEVVAVGFSPGNAEAVVLGVINGARSEIRLCGYSFSSRNVMHALANAKRRGVDVRLVLDSKGTTRTAIKFLNENRISYRTCLNFNIMHNKFIVADGALVQTGSFNYTRAAAVDNAENVIVLRSSQLAGVYLQEWTRLWELSKQK